MGTERKQGASLGSAGELLGGDRVESGLDGGARMWGQRAREGMWAGGLVWARAWKPLQSLA